MNRTALTWMLAPPLLTLLAAGPSTEPVLPYHQTKEPGPSLSPREAMAKMQLPPGFKVTLVASEPDIVNPTAFTFDDQGRIWVTESVEYPRASAGPGQDKIVVCESTNQDGHFDKFTTFKDGLNIPAGIAIGNGGVYVTNSPDVLFLQDSTGAGKADKQTTILTGFGRDDRHELPNSLTWGPDGWLYGMNGVFNQSRVEHDGKVDDFTCAIWRWHPRTHRFELFCQGTSNPWGLDYNRQGDWFVSCCVIDHLFHMTQSGYYERQGGPYPPQTHWLPSITTQRHQMAAYSGLCIYDADQFPTEYRGLLFMGNLHGSAINCDTLTRNGATYVQRDAPDFLQANDDWFMPVSQKIGPDGCLYFIDWYDRYHCYQDAGRDPQGVDRTRGRIYRISYGDPPKVPAFDLQKMSAQELIKLLSHPNVWWQRQAQRVLNERFDESMAPTLKKMALDTSDPTPAHMHALWLLVSQHQLDPEFHVRVLDSADEPTRNWGVRAAGEMQSATPEIFQRLLALTRDPEPDVRVQVAVAAGRLGQPDGMPLLMASLENPVNVADPLIPKIIYNNLLPRIPKDGAQILQQIEKDSAIQKNFGDSVVGWIRDAVNALNRTPQQIVEALAKRLPSNPDQLSRGTVERRTRSDLQSVVDAFETLGVQPAEASRLFDGALRSRISQIAAGNSASRVPATAIALWWDDPVALRTARTIIADPNAPAAVRSQFVHALGRQKSPENIGAFAALLADNSAPTLIRQSAATALGAMDNANAAEALLDHFDQLPVDLRPMVINSLVLSRTSARLLLASIQDKKIQQSNMNENHARTISELGDPELTKQLSQVWGTVRTERDPKRAQLAASYKTLFLSHGGDASKGWLVFDAKCAQCHAIYGRGGAIGPDLTGVGRDNLDLILSNVLDPSLVVGKPYYVYVARLKDGTLYNGLLVEDSPRQVVLKEPTGTHVIPRDQLDKLVQQTISMMPEGLEATMSKDEFCDLIAFLLTKSPPTGK
ncbi:MAG TPA: PVC-type heme-binding CxxCH protein [Tepidisphaeraceae bacterium]|nr:PVC-type heme-binding CxxCH protein [Tepidisphaeraceae bacterium]